MGTNNGLTEHEIIKDGHFMDAATVARVWLDVATTLGAARGSAASHRANLAVLDRRIAYAESGHRLRAAEEGKNTEARAALFDKYRIEDARLAALYVERDGIEREMRLADAHAEGLAHTSRALGGAVTLMVESHADQAVSPVQ